MKKSALTAIVVLLVIVLYAMYQDIYSFSRYGMPMPETPHYRPHAFDQMCHELAESNCQMPTYPLDGCWLAEYQQCIKKGGGMMKCTAQADAQCESSAAPANSCYQGLYQKCMAGRVAGVRDPDRN